MAGAKSLTVLDLSRNRIDFEAAKNVTALLKLPRLKTVAGTTNHMYMPEDDEGKGGKRVAVGVLRPIDGVDSKKWSDKLFMDKEMVKWGDADIDLIAADLLEGRLEDVEKVTELDLRCSSELTIQGLEAALVRLFCETGDDGETILPHKRREETKNLRTVRLQGQYNQAGQSITKKVPPPWVRVNPTVAKGNEEEKAE